MHGIGSGRTSSGPSAELTPNDWQRVMEGVLHPNTEEGKTNLQTTIQNFKKEGKLSSFRQQLREIESYVQQIDS